MWAEERKNSEKNGNPESGCRLVQTEPMATAQGNPGGPGNVREALEGIGFAWFDDDCPSKEDEEKAARPENNRQRQFVSYFEGKAQLSEAVITAFLSEHKAEEPHLSSHQKIFRAANQPLKKLILAGLESDPTNLDLLTDRQSPPARGGVD